MSNVGAFLSALYNFAGVRPKMGASAEVWLARDAALPEGWDELTFGHVELGGAAYRLDAKHGERGTLTPLP